MEVKFDKKGNLQHDLILQFFEFESNFGYNSKREEKIKSLLIVAKIFKSYGCTNIYVGGSFITAKKEPNDIDVCFDITEVIFKKFKIKHPEFFDYRELEKLHKTIKLHIFLFTSYDTDIVDWFRFDRNQNKCGIIKIFLKDLPGYDKE